MSPLNSTHDRLSAVTWLIAVAVHFADARVRGEENPDPRLLIQGMLSARQQTPPSTLKLKYTFKDQVSTNEQVMTVEFDGALRGFDHRDTVSTNLDWSSVFDGARAITYRGGLRQVAYRSLSDQDAEMLFDPRLLGIVYAYAWDERLESLPPPTAPDWKFTLIGREKVENRPAWHARMQLGEGLPTDYWIDPTNGFKVYRMDLNCVQVVSYYDNPSYQWLPSRVVSKTYAMLAPGPDDIPRYQKEMILLEAKAGGRFKKERWSLAGMNLRRGTDVIDRERSISLGKWDGGKMVSEAEISSKPAPVWSRVFMLVLALSPMLFFWRAARKKAA